MLTFPLKKCSFYINLQNSKQISNTFQEIQLNTITACIVPYIPQLHNDKKMSQSHKHVQSTNPRDKKLSSKPWEARPQIRGLVIETLLWGKLQDLVLGFRIGLA